MMHRLQTSINPFKRYRIALSSSSSFPILPALFIAPRTMLPRHLATSGAASDLLGSTATSTDYRGAPGGEQKTPPPSGSNSTASPNAAVVAAGTEDYFGAQVQALVDLLVDTGMHRTLLLGTYIPNSPVLVNLQELADELVDPKAFGKSGEAWVFAQVATIALLVFSPFSLDGPIDFIGVLLLATGVVFLWVRVCRDWGRLTQITMIILPVRSPS